MCVDQVSSFNLKSISSLNLFFGNIPFIASLKISVGFLALIVLTVTSFNQPINCECVRYNLSSSLFQVRTILSALSTIT